MNQEQAIKRLARLDGKDHAAAHFDADLILIEFLSDNGFSEVAHAYEAVEKRADGFSYHDLG